MTKVYDVEVLGDTYPLKRGLSKLGLWWNFKDRTWVARQVVDEDVRWIRQFCRDHDLKIRIKWSGFVDPADMHKLRRGQTVLGTFNHDQN